MSLPWARIDTVVNNNTTITNNNHHEQQHPLPESSPEPMQRSLTPPATTTTQQTVTTPLSTNQQHPPTTPSSTTPTQPLQQQPSPPPPPQPSTTPPQSNTSRSKVAEPNVFWTDHEIWLRESRNQRPKAVMVSDPQQAPRSLSNPNPPITYLVVTLPSISDFAKDGVRRRYSDFETLRTHLILKFPGILLPSLPEKRLIGGKSESFLVDRQRGLLIFLERVVADPYLLMNDVTRIFLSGTNTEWEMTKKQIASTTTPITTTTTFLPPSSPPSQLPTSPTTQQPTIQQPIISSEERWKAAVTMSSLPTNHENELQRARTSLADMEDSLTKVMNVTSKACIAGKQYSTTITELARVLSTQTSDRPLSFLSKAMDSWSDASVLEPIVMEELLMEALMDEIDVIKELRRLVDTRDSLATIADHALRALHKLEVEKESLDKTGQVEKSNKVMIKIQEALRNVKSAEYRVEFATKALFYAGLTSYVSTRIRAIGLVFARFSTAELRYGEMIRSVWLGVVSSVGIDINEFNRDEGTKIAMTRLEARAGPKYKGVFLVE